MFYNWNCGRESKWRLSVYFGNVCEYVEHKEGKILGE